MESALPESVTQRAEMGGNACAEMVTDEDNENSLSRSESEDSDESEQEETDESVIEDMRKLERNLEGIAGRYRLIRRIGEGMSARVHINPY